MRFVRATCLVALLLLLGVTGAQAAASTVTLPGGEHVTIVQTGTETQITLPDGVTITRSDMGNGAVSWGGPASASQTQLNQAQAAYDLWAPATPKPRARTVPVWAALLLTVLGLFNLVAPQAAWQMAEGWKFRDAEPSDFALGFTRFGGAVVAVVGAGMLLWG